MTPPIGPGDKNNIFADMTNMSQRGAASQLWLKVFPDHNKWLALHGVEYKGNSNGMLVQPKIMGVLD